MNNTENLEGIVSKLKQQGIEAGEVEKKQIIEDAQKEAKRLIAEAESKRTEILEDAKNKSVQLEKNADKAIKQASRDMVEATKIALLKHLKSVFGEKCETLFTLKEYLEVLLKMVVDQVNGKKLVKLPADMVKPMESFLKKEALSSDVELQPLAETDAKIVVSSTENKGVQLVLSSKDVEDGLFALMNKELVDRITHTQEG